MQNITKYVHLKGSLTEATESSNDIYAQIPIDAVGGTTGTWDTFNVQISYDELGQVCFIL